MNRSRGLSIALVAAVALAVTAVTVSARAAELGSISPNDTPAQIQAKAAKITPSPRQLAWQRLEQTAFIHFGVNTYDDREVGTGTENPNIFQPTGLDTDQWITSLRDGGFKEAVLTAKHHDGFLLFPSKYSKQGVASSSWRGGKGDVVKDFTTSAHKFGMKVGIYLSPADIHEAQPGGRFANGSKAVPRTIPSDSSEIVGGHTFHFTADDYNTYYMNTLYELLTRYGSIDEIWWDNAAKAGTGQKYNFTDWITMVRTLQPNAVMLNDGGPDVRWVGNENGKARQSEWSPLPFTGDPATAADRMLTPNGGPTGKDLGSDAVLGQRKADGTSAWNLLRWTPAECDTTMMNQGWFWHANETPKSPSALVDIYYNSVGHNCNLLLDLPPDPKGVFDQTTLNALSTYHNTISKTFGTNLAAGAGAANDTGTTNTSGHSPALAVDGSLDTSWQPGKSTGALVLSLNGTKTFDVISVQEDLNVGMRTRTFAVDAWNGTAWTQIATDTTIGQKKLIRLSSKVTTSRIRLRITSSRSNTAIASVGLFLRPGGGSASVTGAITSGLAGKCLNVAGAGTANGTKVQLWDCKAGIAAQTWTVSPDGGPITNNGKCLDIYNGSSDGALLEIWDCNGGWNQQWQPRNEALVNPTSGRCLDVPKSSTTNGTQLDIWGCNGGTNQKWTLPN
jgi:alpha-L-fucosidase